MLGYSAYELSAQGGERRTRKAAPGAGLRELGVEHGRGSHPLRAGESYRNRHDQGQDRQDTGDARAEQAAHQARFHAAWQHHDPPSPARWNCRILANPHDGRRA